VRIGPARAHSSSEISLAGVSLPLLHCSLELIPGSGGQRGMEPAIQNAQIIGLFNRQADRLRGRRFQAMLKSSEDQPSARTDLAVLLVASLEALEILRFTHFKPLQT